MHGLDDFRDLEAILKSQMERKWNQTEGKVISGLDWLVGNPGMEKDHGNNP